MNIVIKLINRNIHYNCMRVDIRTMVIISITVLAMMVAVYGVNAAYAQQTAPEIIYANWGICGVLLFLFGIALHQIIFIGRLQCR